MNPRIIIAMILLCFLLLLIVLIYGCKPVDTVEGTAYKSTINTLFGIQHTPSNAAEITYISIDDALLIAESIDDKDNLLSVVVIYEVEGTAWFLRKENNTPVLYYRGDKTDAETVIRIPIEDNDFKAEVNKFCAGMGCYFSAEHKKSVNDFIILLK